MTHAINRTPEPTPAPDREWIGDLALEPIEPGARVTLIHNINLRTGELFVFGSGVYEGTYDRPAWYESDKARPGKRFLLDTGQTVWDVECWWGAEERVKELYDDLRWTTVPVVNREVIEKFSIVMSAI